MFRSKVESEGTWSPDIDVHAVQLLLRLRGGQCQRGGHADVGCLQVLKRPLPAVHCPLSFREEGLVLSLTENK